MQTSNKKRTTLLVFLVSFIFSQISFAQTDSSETSFKNLQLSPSFHGIQVDILTAIFSRQIGGHVDFDFLHSRNNNFCIGTRMSLEHYSNSNFGGKELGSPFTNYNIYARISKKKNNLSIDLLGGMTHHTTSNSEYLPNRTLFRTGFEVKYNIAMFGILVKGATSFKDNTHYLGIGFSLGYDHNIFE